MKATTVIKNELRKIGGISWLHFFFAVLAAVMVPASAMLIVRVDMAEFSKSQLVIAFVVTALSQLFFFSSVRFEKRSVFWFTKCLYIVAVPIGLMFLSDALFDPNKVEHYSQNFYSSVLPKWSAVWWLGSLLAFGLMRASEYSAKKGIANGRFAAKAAYALAVMYTPQKVVSRKKRAGRSKWAAAIVCMVMVALAAFLGTLALYLYCVYTNMDFEAILFTVSFAEGGLAIEDIIACASIVVIIVGITVYGSFQLLKCFMNDEVVVEDTVKGGKYTLVMNRRKRVLSIVLSVAMLAGCTALFSAQTNFFHYMNMKFHNSNIYDDYYVNPDESVLTFPEKKRNLIYIYLESMENSYASREEGGSQDRNYISELVELSKQKDSVNFSHTSQLGGASVYVPSITYTMGSTVAQTAGISLNTKLFHKSSAREFPSVRRLEDILHDNGYNQLYIEGSKGEFSMYDTYVGRYDDCKVFDRKTAADEGYTDEDADYMWKWGIEDRKLFEITKELITDISQKDKPFFVTMYTMDTHSYESGHRCPNCDSSIKNDYLAAVDCSSRTVCEFIEWVKHQPFYENTTIVLVGDHLGNKKTSMVDFDSDYLRTTYNCIINPAKQAADPKERVFSSVDMFPTTLSAIGVEIKGDRLGLGTDLFSKTKTLCEELGEEEYKKQLEQSSDYYDREFYGQ